MGWNPLKKMASIFKRGRFGMAIMSALGSGRAGAWASDHRTEADNYTGWTFVAVKAICLQVMQAQVSVYDESQETVRRKSRVVKSLYAGEDGEAEPLPNTHPLCKILKRPNPSQSGAMFRYERVLQLQLTGTCIVWNVPNQFGKPVERYVIPTAMASPIQPCADFPEGGFKISSTSSRYAIVDADGFTNARIFNEVAGKVIPLKQLQVSRWPHPLYKDDGQSPVSAGAKWIDSANQIDQARWSQMNNGADPSVVVTYGKDVNPTQEELDVAVKKFEQKYTGTENTGKALFTTGDKVTALTHTAKEMSYGEGFEQMRDSILALHGVPGVAAGITDGGSYAAFYASLKQFICLTVQPILDLLAEDDTEQLAPSFGQGLIIEMESASIDDPEVLMQELTTDITANAITRDEYRAKRGMAPLGPDKGGDELIGAIQPLAAEGQSMPTPFSTGHGGPPTPQEKQPDPVKPEPVEKPEAKPEQKPESEPVPEAGENVKETALNGAQVSSLMSMATALSQKQLPYDTVRKLIEAAFPLMKPELIDEILKPLKTFEPPGEPEGNDAKSFLDNEAAFHKAHNILKLWNDYPGGKP